MIDDPRPSGAPGGDGKSDGAGGGSSGSGLTATDFLHQIGMIQCDHAFSCRASYPGGDAAFVRVFGASAAECYGDADDFYRPDRVDRQIDRGKIAYDSDAAAQCLAGTSLGASCAAYWMDGTQFDPACDAALVGKVADGDECETVFDCAGPDSSCDLDQGVCVPD